MCGNASIPCLVHEFEKYKVKNSAERDFTGRVLVAHNLPRGSWGGAVRMMESSHQALESFGWQTDYFTTEDMPPSSSMRYRRYAFSWHLRRHARAAFLRGQPYDIINVHEPAGAAVVASRSAMGAPAVVAMSHGLEQRYWELRRRAAGPKPEPPLLKERITFPLLSLWQSRLTLRRADHVFCLSDDDKTFLQARHHLTADKITRVIPGAGAEFSAVLSRRVYDRPCTKLLFSGTWSERKGKKYMAEAFSILALKNSALQLGILGAGVPAASLLADFPPELHPRVTVYPPLSHAECAEVLLDYDIFLLPSFFEGTPLALIEGMYTGIPVITTATCGMKDIVENGRTGILINPGNTAEIVDAVEQLTQNAELRSRMGRAAAANAISNYTWQATAQRMHLAYSALLLRKRAR